MTIPLVPRILALVLVTTSFYAYVGQLVPQNEVQPPAEILIRTDLTTADMVTVGREVMDRKGLCFTCHTIGRSGALRFPDLAGVGDRAATRVPGLSDVEYFAQSLYQPDTFIVPGFNPGMPVINKPPIGLTDQEILCVIAYLQSLGGTPTVTLQTSHTFYTPAGAAPAAAAGAATPSAAPTVAAPAPTVAPGAPATPAGGPGAPGVPPAPGGVPPSAVPPARGTPGTTPASPGAVPAPAVPPGGAMLRPDASPGAVRLDGAVT